MMGGLISVIVPVFQVEEYLDRCIQSIVNQSYINLEIILVDDGSHDSCPQMCDAWAEKDRRVRVIHKENAGLGMARNSGIEVAAGEYVAFIDSDDYIDREFIHKLYAETVKNNADACIGGSIDVFGNNEQEFKPYFAGTFLCGADVRETLLASMLGYDHRGSGYSGISVARGIYKRDVLERFNIRFPSEREYISEDVIFDIHFYRVATRVAVADYSGYFYCHNEGSLTTSYRKDRFDQCRILYLHELELLKGLDHYFLYRDRVTSMFLANTRVSLKQEAEHLISTWKDQNIRRRICSIIQSPELIEALEYYDYSKMPFRQKVFCCCIKHSLWRSVFLMALLQSRSKKC